jgi:hypothetical protein
MNIIPLKPFKMLVSADGAVIGVDGGGGTAVGLGGFSTHPNNSKKEIINNNLMCYTFFI